MSTTRPLARRTPALLRAAFLAALCLAPSWLHAGAFFRRIFGLGNPPRTAVYRVVDLGATAPNGDSEAFGINNAGEVVGWVRVNGQKQAVVWRNIATQPTMAPLWTIPNHNSIAYQINDAHQPAGWAGGGLAPGEPQVFQVAKLGPPGVEGRAYGISENTLVVGWSYLSVGASNQKAVVFNGGVPLASSASPILPPVDLGNFGTDNSRAYDVNRAFVIVGAAATAAGPSHAFRHVGASPLQPSDDLGTLGGLNSEATGINERGQVAGWSDLVRCAGRSVRHAFLWENNQMRDLGTPYPRLPVTINEPSGAPRRIWWASTMTRVPDGDGGNCINDRDGNPQIVGYTELYYTAVPPQPYDPNCIRPTAEPGMFHRAFMWDGTMHDLNDMIPSNSGWYLTEAWGVNDRGQIVGRGLHNGSFRAFVLLP